MTKAASTTESLQAQFQEYSIFVETRLRPDFEQAEKARKETELEIQEYVELQQHLQRQILEHDGVGGNNDWSNLLVPPKQKLKNRKQDQQQQQQEQVQPQHLVDLGYGMVYCNVELDQQHQEEAPTPPMLFVLVGMGFHIEMTVEEAVDFTKRRVEFLKQHVLPKRVEKEAKINAHLQSSTVLMHELNRQLQQL